MAEDPRSPLPLPRRGVEDRVRASASAAAGASALPAPALPPGAGALDAELEGRIDAKLKAWAEEQMTWARQQALAVELRLQQLAAVQEDRTREWVRELVSGAAREAAAEAVGETQAGLREAAGRIEARAGPPVALSVALRCSWASPPVVLPSP